MDGYRIEESTELIFLGTGTSGGVPDLGCVVDLKKRCATCEDALKEGSRNRRQNTSIIIKTNYKKVREIETSNVKYEYNKRIKDCSDFLVCF